MLSWNEIEHARQIAQKRLTITINGVDYIYTWSDTEEKIMVQSKSDNPYILTTDNAVSTDVARIVGEHIHEMFK